MQLKLRIKRKLTFVFPERPSVSIRKQSLRRNSADFFFSTFFKGLQPNQYATNVWVLTHQFTITSPGYSAFLSSIFNTDYSINNWLKLSESVLLMGTQRKSMKNYNFVFRSNQRSLQLIMMSITTDCSCCCHFCKIWFPLELRRP